MSNKIDWNETIESVREVYFDLSANYGALRARMKSPEQESLLGRYQEELGGSYGVSVRLAELAEEFQTWWKSLPADDARRESYYEMVDDFFDDKLAADIADRTGVPKETVLERLKPSSAGYPLLTGKTLYAVSGRIPKSDDDTVHIVVANSEDEAWQAFKDEMNSGRSEEAIKADEGFHGTSVFSCANIPIGQFQSDGTLKVTASRSEMVYAGSYHASVSPPTNIQEDPIVRVRQVGADAEWTEWNISQNLTDRWGDLNSGGDVKNGQLLALENDPDLLQRLRDQMWDEICFIVRKDGEYGILFEVEYSSIESDAEEARRDDDGEFLNDLLPQEVMVGGLKKGMAALQEQFPGVLFAVPEETNIVNARPAAWAYVKDGMLNETQREVLGNYLLSIQIEHPESVDAPAAMGMKG